VAIHKSVKERADADPSNTEWQRDLSVSHNGLGDVAQAAGDLTAARTAYQASLDIRTRLTAGDPTNTLWQEIMGALRGRLRNLDQRETE